MIIYDPVLKPCLSEFGLNIPLDDSRWERTLEELAKNGNLSGGWLYEGPWAQVGREDLLLAHEPAYIRELYDDPDTLLWEIYEGHRYGTGVCPRRPLRKLLDRAVKNVSATLTACEQALESGWAYAMGGGMHHALSFAGHGFLSPQ